MVGQKSRNPPLQCTDYISCSPDELCNQVCNKLCFASRCFDWCLTHCYPSAEGLGGTISYEVQYVTKDLKGQLVSRVEVEQRRVCGHQDAKAFSGDCHIVMCPIPPEAWLWQFEQERAMREKNKL